MDTNMRKAIAVFNQGGIVIFPTDTAFGIGCRVDNEEAVKKLYTIRKRPATQPASILVSSVEMAKKYAYIPSEVETRLIKPYWPGGLTIVLQSRIKKVPTLVRGGGETIGLRMPDHNILRKIIAEVGVPILGPSANFHGEKTPFQKEDLDPQLVKQVDFVLGGSCMQDEASTVIDCVSIPWKILREGSVKVAV